MTKTAVALCLVLLFGLAAADLPVISSQGVVLGTPRGCALRAVPLRARSSPAHHLPLACSLFSLRNFACAARGSRTRERLAIRPSIPQNPSGHLAVPAPAPPLAITGSI